MAYRYGNRQMQLQAIVLLCLIAFSTVSFAGEEHRGFETKTVFVLDTFLDADGFSNVVADCAEKTGEDKSKLVEMIEKSAAHYKAATAYLEAKSLGKDEKELNVLMFMRAIAGFKEVEELNILNKSGDRRCKSRVYLYFSELLDVFPNDINFETSKGWEVKSTRRAWKDLWTNNKIDDFEWGTEYILQRPIK